MLFAASAPRRHGRCGHLAPSRRSTSRLGTASHVCVPPSVGGPARRPSAHPMAAIDRAGHATIPLPPLIKPVYFCDTPSLTPNTKLDLPNSLPFSPSSISAARGSEAVAASATLSLNYRTTKQAQESVASRTPNTVTDRAVGAVMRCTVPLQRLLTGTTSAQVVKVSGLPFSRWYRMRLRW